MWPKLLVVLLMAPLFAASAAVQSRVADIQLAGVVPRNSAEQFELAFWESIKNSGHVSDYEAYLKTYPKGRFVALAQARIARLHASAATSAPTATAAPAEPVKPTAKPTVKPAAKPAVTPTKEPPVKPAEKPATEPPRAPARTVSVPKKKAAKPAPVAAAAPIAPSSQPAALEEVKDCPSCPTLVYLFPGSFTMGSDSGDPSEKPAHNVTLATPFAIGKYEVTCEEWNACVAAGACQRLGQSGNPTPKAPVRDVSWDDVQQYLKWLRTSSGKPYRLPSEAEWEYAARAGTSTRYWWGERMEAGKANCKDCGPPWPGEELASVGTFAANPNGLHDMSGSVWEWVADCWHGSFKGSPGNGQIWDEPGCSVRVIRGGSWRETAPYMASSTRARHDAGVRNPQNGFRVARDVE